MKERVLAHRVLATLVRALLRQPPRRHSAPACGGPVRFLVMDLHERGGSVRSNLLLAAGLVRQHPVEVLSLFVDQDEPFYPLPPGVTRRVLDDRRAAAPTTWLQRRLGRLPSVLMHPDDRSITRYTLWSDVVLVRALRRLEGGWLITTRPALHLLAARFTPPGVVVVAREHDNFTTSTPALRDDLRSLGSGLDAVAVLTHGDEHDYRALLGPLGVEVFQAPNALEPMAADPVVERSRVVLAAGRLVRQKGFDLLIQAFAPVADKHPDWCLRVFGDGPERDRLEQLVDSLGLAGSVQLLPSTRRIGQEMAGAGLFVLSSRFEGFGRVVLESLSAGLPVVSFDCPRGPGEILTAGHDGLLVPAEDVGALTTAVLSLIEDDGLRHRLGAAGPSTAARYDLPTITARWERALAASAERRG